MKKYDVVATCGQYQDQSNGEKKYINRNVGAVIQTKEGYHKLVLDAHFNPAGLNKDDNGRVWLNLFEPRQENITQKTPVKQTKTNDSIDDNIPF